MLMIYTEKLTWFTWKWTLERGDSFWTTWLSYLQVNHVIFRDLDGILLTLHTLLRLFKITQRHQNKLMIMPSPEGRFWYLNYHPQSDEAWEAFPFPNRGILRWSQPFVFRGGSPKKKPPTVVIVYVTLSLRDPFQIAMNMTYKCAWATKYLLTV